MTWWWWRWLPFNCHAFHEESFLGLPQKSERWRNIYGEITLEIHIVVSSLKMEAVICSETLIEYPPIKQKHGIVAQKTIWIFIATKCSNPTIKYSVNSTSYDNLYLLVYLFILSYAYSNIISVLYILETIDPLVQFLLLDSGLYYQLEKNLNLYTFGLNLGTKSSHFVSALIVSSLWRGETDFCCYSPYTNALRHVTLGLRQRFENRNFATSVYA
jgi:hypothetical protein